MFVPAMYPCQVVEVTQYAKSYYKYAGDKPCTPHYNIQKGENTQHHHRYKTNSIKYPVLQGTTCVLAY